MSMADENCSEERETSVYLMHIQYLDKKLESCQLKCDELEKQNQNLVLQCKVLEEDEKDFELLKRFKAEKEKEVDELAVMLETQQQVAEQTLKELKLQQSLELEELQERVDKLNSQIRELDAQSEEKDLQKKLLEQQMCDSESLEEKLLSEEKMHESILEALKSNIKTEMDSVFYEGMETVTDWSDRKISEIIQEETAQHRELALQLQEALDKIHVQREQISMAETKESNLYSEIEGLEADAAEMEKNLSTVETDAEKLTERKTQLQRKTMKCVRISESIMARMDQLSQQLSSAMEENFQKTNMAAQLEAELQEERTRRAVLEDDMRKAVIVLRHVLEASGEPVGTLLSQDLLRILERNLPEGEDSTLRESIETRSGVQKPKTSERAETLDLATDPQFLLARCRPGDFSFIPRPTWKPRPL